MPTSGCAVVYTICAFRPEAHVFRVTCAINAPSPDGQVVSLPAWIPGSYMIREFAKNIVSIKASSNGAELALEKLDKQTWRCAATQDAITIEYDVYAWDLSVRSAHLDQTHGFFNGTSVFLRVHGLDGQKCAVEIRKPVGKQYNDWRVATSLKKSNDVLYTFGWYEAQSYDELIDHPVEMGNFTLATFTACDVQHDIVITGRHRADMDRLCADLKKICEYEIRFFGEPAPMGRYVFLVMVVGTGYGGLEHRASTSLLCSRDDLPRKGEAEIREEYRTFLELCSHEYFHTWNIKRIKPAVFEPYSLASETYTPLLWAFEGITSYYDQLVLVRAGLITVESFLELLGQTITRVLRAPGRFKQSVTESSFDAWTKFYKQDENSVNAIVSYYTKGALVALALDLLIRKRTDNKQSLDDVMRYLWKEYGQTNDGVGVDDIQKAVGFITGHDFNEFFNQALLTTHDIELAPLFEYFAVKMNLRAALSQADKGGKKGAESGKPILSIGATLSNAEGGAKLGFVFENGPAQLAGLSSGDVIIAIDGLRIGAEMLEKILSRYKKDELIKVHAFRRDELIEFTIKLKPAGHDTCFLSLIDGQSEGIRRRESWLAGVLPTG